MAKQKRGGARINSGAKKKGIDKKEPVTFYYEQWKIAKLGGKDRVREAAILGCEMRLSSFSTTHK